MEESNEPRRTFTGERRTFLGMTKPGFVGALIVYLIVSTTYFTVMSIRHDMALSRAIDSNHAAITSNHKLALAGAQAHTSLCAFRESLAKDIDAQQVKLNKSRSFFTSHPTALSDVPRSVIRQGFADTAAQIARQRVRLAAIDATLHNCKR